jgi:hypothetical protein
MGTGLLRGSWYVAFAVTVVMLLFAATAHAETASLAFNPPSYEFGTRLPGAGPSPSQAFTLTNTGEFNLPVEYAALAWGPQEYAEPELFKVTSNNCGTLAPGASCTIEVAFNPVVPGLKWGTLTVAAPWSENCNLIEECQPINVQAQLHLTGIASTVALSPASLTFPPLEVGTGPPLRKLSLSPTRANPISRSSVWYWPTISTKTPASFGSRAEPVRPKWNCHRRVPARSVWPFHPTPPVVSAQIWASSTALQWVSSSLPSKAKGLRHPCSPNQPLPRGCRSFADPVS